MKQQVRNGASVMHRHVAQTSIASGVGTLDEIWQNNKALILLGGVVAGIVYLARKKSNISDNPNSKANDANLVLGHIDEFAAEHSPKEVAHVLGQVEKKFPSMAGRVAAARARVL